MERQRLWRMLTAASFFFLLAPWAVQAAIDPATAQKLLAGDGTDGDLFGHSVSLSADGDILLIGAQGKDNRTGAAYIFTRNNGGYTQQAKLTAADGIAEEYFGSRSVLSKDSTTALIGLPDDDDKGTDSGAVYVFTRAIDGSWPQIKLTATDGVAGGLFGFSVSLSADGNTALIGADCFDSGSGAAYVFTRIGGIWGQRQKLTATDSESGKAFAASVALSTDAATALIGAGGDDRGKGAAYIFTRAADGSYSQRTKLIAEDVVLWDEFGTEISLSADGSTALIGAPFKSDLFLRGGAAYVFIGSGSNWTQQAKLHDYGDDQWFGVSVSLTADGSTALIGTSYRQAYVWTRSGGS